MEPKDSPGYANSLLHYKRQSASLYCDCDQRRENLCRDHETQHESPSGGPATEEPRVSSSTSGLDIGYVLHVSVLQHERIKHLFYRAGEVVLGTRG